MAALCAFLLGHAALLVERNIQSDRLRTLLMQNPTTFANAATQFPCFESVDLKENWRYKLNPSFESNCNDTTLNIYIESPSIVKTEPRSEEENSECDEYEADDPPQSQEYYVPYPEVETSLDVSPAKKVKKPPSKPRKPETWKCNIRKASREAGKSYINTRGKFVPEKELKEPCSGCIYECNTNISEEQRQRIFEMFYCMDSFNKKIYVLQHCQQLAVQRHRARKNDTVRRQNSFKYFLNVDGIEKRVCKVMFLNTLSISSKYVYGAHENKTNCNLPIPSKWGKHKKRTIPEVDKEFLRRHIESFPRVSSQYSSKEFLDSSLNITRMYRLYEELCKEQNRTPLKLSTYRYIFNTEYDLDFLKPPSGKG